MKTSATLHIVNKSPFSHRGLQRCLDLAQKEDGIILIEDGVYGCQQLQTDPRAGDLKCYALQEDCQARNADTGSIDQVDYDGFVALCSTYQKTVSWF